MFSSLVLGLGLDALVGLEVLVDRRDGWDLTLGVGSAVASAAGGPEEKNEVAGQHYVAKARR